MEQFILKTICALLTLGIYVFGSMPFVALFVGMWILQKKENEKKEKKRKENESSSTMETPKITEIGEQIVDFGIHEDSKYKHVPRDYLDWMISVGGHHRRKWAEAELNRRETGGSEVEDEITQLENMEKV